MLQFLYQPTMEQTLLSPSVVVVTVVLMTVVAFWLFKTGGTVIVHHEDVSSALRKEEKESQQDNCTSDDGRVLNPAVFKTFKILKIVRVSYNTKLIRFEIPHGKSLGLPIGRHISIKAEIDGNNVIRAYTPTSKPNQCGYFEIVIKNYEMGKLSPFLHSLKVGSSVSVRGPVGRFKYEKNAFKRIGLVAGGSGLTPCLQLMRSLLESPDMADDNTSLVLLFQNRTEDDILLREELDALQGSHRSRVQIVYYLSNAQTKEFSGCVTSQQVEKRGYIDQQAVQSLLHPIHCQLVCICGPSGFNQSVKKLLVDAGHEEKAIYVW